MTKRFWSQSWSEFSLQPGILQIYPNGTVTLQSCLILIKSYFFWPHSLTNMLTEFMKEIIMMYSTNSKEKRGSSWGFGYWWVILFIQQSFLKAWNIYFLKQSLIAPIGSFITLSYLKKKKRKWDSIHCTTADYSILKRVHWVLQNQGLLCKGEPSLSLNYCHCCG